MICKNCNASNADDASFCSSCGGSLNSATNSTSKLNSTYTYNTNQSSNRPIDNPSHFAGIVSCCFPIVGLILYFIWKDDKPESAKLVCYWMIGGLVAWVAFYFIFFLFGAASTSMYY